MGRLHSQDPDECIKRVFHTPEKCVFRYSAGPTQALRHWVHFACYSKVIFVILRHRNTIFNFLIFFSENIVSEQRYVQRLTPVVKHCV